MAYTRTADERHDFIASTHRPNNGRGFFRRAFDAMVEGRRRTAEREIATFLEGHGKYLTDEAEREIERILSAAKRF